MSSWGLPDITQLVTGKACLAGTPVLPVLWGRLVLPRALALIFQSLF